MKTKLFGVIALSIVFLAVMISGVSAFSIISSNNSVTFTNSGEVQTINFNANQGNLYNISVSSVSNGFSINSFNFNPKNTSKASYNISFTTSKKFNYGGHVSSVLSLNASNSTGYSEIKNITLNYIKSFCQSGDVNDSNVTMYVNIQNEGTGSSTDWNPLDTIEVQVTLSPNGNTNLNNVELELGLINNNTGRDIASQMIWPSGQGDKYDVGYLSSSEGDIPYTFTFQVNPQIFNLFSSTNYILMVKAYNQNNQNQFCVDYSNGFSDGNIGNNNYFSNIQIQPQYSSNKMVIFDSNALSQSYQNVSCGQQFTINPLIYNVGPNSNAVSQDQVLAVMNIPDLGIKSNQTLSGLNAGGKEQTSFSSTVPINASEGMHDVYFVTYYGYNTNNQGYDIGGNYYNYVSDSYKTDINIQGNCVYATPATTSVQAQLQSGGKAGQPLVIQATISNTGTKTVNYNLGLEGYTTWATLSSITPSNITLAPGQSQNVMINMNVNKDATGGDKQFSLDVYSNGYLITQQPLSLTVTQTFWNSITGGAISGSSVALWGFNIVLIVAIIVVLILVLRRKK